MIEVRKSKHNIMSYRPVSHSKLTPHATKNGKTFGYGTFLPFDSCCYNLSAQEFLNSNYTNTCLVLYAFPSRQQCSQHASVFFHCTFFAKKTKHAHPHCVWPPSSLLMSYTDSYTGRTWSTIDKLNLHWTGFDRSFPARPEATRTR